MVVVFGRSRRPSTALAAVHAKFMLRNMKNGQKKKRTAAKQGRLHDICLL
jgi:hypothetical protein